MTSRRIQPIDEHVAAEIKRLRKKHPKLGHEGLMDALAQSGIRVDEAELKVFLKSQRMKPEAPSRKTWGHVGAGYATWGALADSSHAPADAGDGGDGD
jgi:hypothetical protein